MVCLNESIHMEILDWFPRIVTVWVPLPFDEVLESTHLTEEAVIDDGLDFIFRVFVNEVWGRLGVVWTVHGSFLE